MFPNKSGIDSSSPIDVLMSDFDLATLTGRARSTWQKARLTGDGPPFVRLGRLVRYRKADVVQWLASRPLFHSTSDGKA